MKSLNKILKKKKPLNFYQSFITFFLKGGKKTRVKALIDKAFLKLSKKFKCTQHFLLVKFFAAINTFVEVKKVKVRRKVFFVPFALTRKRRVSLALKWFRNAIKINKQPIPFINKFSAEMSKIFLGEFCFTRTQLFNNNKLASSNRSKIHYRW